MTADPLRNYTDRTSVSNVCVFICDSLRYDHLPDWIRDMGISAESIAPSSSTAASVPSLVTGQYPSSHGCWTFHDKLPNQPRLFEQPNSFKADTIWTHLDAPEKPPIRNTDANTGPGISDLDDGFVFIEHDKGGHSPYGYSFAEHSTPSFYSSLNHSEKIPDLYEQSIEDAGDRFRELLDRAKAQGRFEETLLIFTSDHGEILGEEKYGGIYGHGIPIVPEVVRTPLVFIGAGLPEGVKFDLLTSGVDLAPTIVSAILEEEMPNADGVDLWRDTPPDRTPRTEYWASKKIRNKEFDYYKAVSGWSTMGGIVCHRGPSWNRLAAALISQFYMKPSAPHVRRGFTPTKLRNLVATYAPKILEYGEPQNIDVESLLSNEFPSTPENTQRKYAKEQLRQLGYIE